MLRSACCLWMICLCSQVSGQLKYNNNWYFGAKASMDFNKSPVSTGNNSVMSTYRCAASVSDPETGQLLLYTNGNSFWNRFGEMVDSSIQGQPSPDVIIIPLKQYKNRFIVFNFSYYFIIDMEARGGRGRILESKVFALRATLNRMTAVKHCLSESYWLITIYENSFSSYLVHPNGMIDEPVISVHPTIKTTNALGDFVSSNNGEKLAFTCYSPTNTDVYYEPQIFDFDKRCGTVDPGRIALPMEQGWDRPHGISFSPDDQLVYVAYGYVESQLVQYKVISPNAYHVVAESPQNFNQIACGPDGRLYITTHIDNIPSNKLDAVLNPNTFGAACNYRENHLRLNGVTNFEVPNMIVCHSGTCSGNRDFRVDVDAGTCLGQPAHFSVKGSLTGIDSMSWHFNDSLYPGRSKKQALAEYTYSVQGNYKPYLLMYFCGHSDTTFFNVLVTSPPKFSLGRDTTMCHGDSVRIGYALANTLYKWNTGAFSAYISVRKPGTYILELNRQGCKSSDTVVMAYYLPIELLLGDDYYICEEEKELVQLDAGKGFKTYLWHPTNDTTQWIEVGKQGNYYIVVRDYRGCKGNDGAFVESRCDLRVFIPNAFTPNGDGLNDMFRVTSGNETSINVLIYSTWGELIYDGTAEWDGTYKGQSVPQGVYMVKVKVYGFLNKKPVEKTYSQTLQVIK